MFVIDACEELLQRSEMQILQRCQKKFSKFVKEVGAKMTEHPLRKFELNEKFKST